jgi:nitrite reductase/ring-hydroxylating ferredoxin subunit
MAKIFVAKVSELAPGSTKQVKISDGKEVVVANIDGKFYSIGGICNHAGGPLGEGTLEGNVITCPWHGSKWDVTTGKMVEFAMDLDPEPVYQVSVEGDSVYVEA